jgi:ferredoxin
MFHMKATVDKETCIGCGLCEEICPEVFTMGGDMIAVALAGDIEPGLEEKARDAAASCPVEAISLA